MHCNINATVTLLSSLKGDVGPAGPPGPIGETGHGLPGPKVNTAIFLLECLKKHICIDYIMLLVFITVFCLTREIVVIQDYRVQLVQRVKAFLALWFVSPTKKLQILRVCNQ